MKKQDLFDVVVKHALTMKSKSMDEFGNCSYRSHKNGACFIGVLINDNHYDKSLENKSIETKKVQRAVKDSGYKIIKKDVPFLLGLQSVHDNNYQSEGLSFVNKLYNDLISFADLYDLKIKKKYNKKFKTKISSMKALRKKERAC